VVCTSRLRQLFCFTGQPACILNVLRQLISLSIPYSCPNTRGCMIHGCQKSGRRIFPAIDGLYIIVQPTGSESVFHHSNTVQYCQRLGVIFSIIMESLILMAKLFALLIIRNLGPSTPFFYREEHLKGIGWMLDSRAMSRSTYILLYYSPVT